MDHLPAPHPGRDGAASGYVCPTCGGALWERRDGDSRIFECRIGHAFEALELWIAHCAARNGALQVAARSLAENAALARKLAAWSRERGDGAAAERIEAEAASEERSLAHVQRMLDGLESADHGPGRR